MKSIKKLFLNSQSHGFTIIELVIVIAILALLSTGSFVGFNTYNNSAKLNSAVESLQTNINEAKASALSGAIYKCVTGQSLYAYRVSINSSSSYSLYEICKDNSTGALTSNQLANKIFSLQNGVTISPVGGSVTFAAVTGIPQASATFTLTIGSKSSSVVVDSSGVIK